MSYCVNCGVELGKGLKKCPLCGTKVINPAALKKEEGEPFFPTRREEVPPVAKREAALLISAMLASVALCCALLNLVLKPQVPWWLYMAGASAMLWIWFVPPLLFRKMPGWPRLAINLCAVALYVFLISLASGGLDWYRGFALPVLLWAAALALLASWLMRGGRHSLLISAFIVMLAVGLLALGVEFFLDSFLRGSWAPGWSLVVMAVSVGLSIPLLVVRFVPSLREEVRRRFHM